MGETEERLLFVRHEELRCPTCGYHQVLPVERRTDSLQRTCFGPCTGYVGMRQCPGMLNGYEGLGSVY